MKSFYRIKHQCPFCNEWVEHWNICNGFCNCFAKYYSQENVWLNRKTGETRKGTLNLEVIENELLDLNIKRSDNNGE